MPRCGKCIFATLLFLSMTGLKPAAGQQRDEFLVPEFFISLAPSVVTVVQGEQTMVTVTIRCTTYSWPVAQDCNARPKFDLYLSEFPEGASAQVAAGRVGDNTISIAASSAAKAGSFPVQVTVEAGTTRQVQTFMLNIREAASRPPLVAEIREPLAVPAAHPPAWEHHVLVAKTPEEFNRMANDLGRDSWELVSVVSRQNTRGAEWIGFFRRPRR